MNTNLTLTVANPVLDFFTFLRRPDADRLSASLKQKLLILAVILALETLLSFLANVLSASVEAFILTEAEHVMQEDSEMLLFMAVTGIFIVPVVEEVAFRLWLIPNPLFFFISFTLTTIQLGPLVPFPFANLLREAGLADAILSVRVALYLTIGAAIALFFWLHDRRGQRYADFFRRYVAVYYYVAAIAFGFAHLANYSFNVEPWWYAPLLILPQLIGGFVYGYVCIRLGFWYAVSAHLLTNLLWTLGDGMNALFGEMGGVVWLAILVLGSLTVMVMAFRKNLVSVEKTLP